LIDTVRVDLRGAGREFLASKEVKHGIANSFMNDVLVWNKRRKVHQPKADGEFANEQSQSGE
jgi:hypothetical protein